MTETELDVIEKRRVLVNGAEHPAAELTALVILLRKDIPDLTFEVRRLNATIDDLRYDADHNARR